MPRGEGRGKTIDERLWPRLVEEDTGYSTPCWLWTGGTDTGGYGKIWFEGRLQGVHLVAYKLVIGPPPAGFELDHLCRVRLCARLLHLEAVPPAVNSQRGLTGAHHAAKTHCPKGHPYSGPNLRIVSTSHQVANRLCLTCRREYAHEYYLAHKGGSKQW